MEYVQEEKKWQYVWNMVNTVLGNNDSQCKVISSRKMRAGMRGHLTLRFGGLLINGPENSESRPVDRQHDDMRGREASELDPERKSANKDGDLDIDEMARLKGSDVCHLLCRLPYLGLSEDIAQALISQLQEPLLTRRPSSSTFSSPSHCARDQRYRWAPAGDIDPDRAQHSQAHPAET
jgi:hypothetical protein